MEKFHFFWSGPFSQWHKSDFVIQGIEYNCAEQFMMAGKAKLFNDHESSEKIMNALHPSDQKELGKKVANFDKTIWEQNCKSIVYRGNYAKFTQNRKLSEFMESTIGETIVEASPYDTIWGIGLAETYPGIEDRNQWRGTNWLGEVLMWVRDDLFVSPYGVIDKPLRMYPDTKLGESKRSFENTFSAVPIVQQMLNKE